MNIFETILKESEIAAAALEAKTEAAKKERMEKLVEETRLIERLANKGGVRSDAINISVLAEKIKEYGPYKISHNYGVSQYTISNILNGRQKTLSLPLVEFFLRMFGPEILKSKG